MAFDTLTKGITHAEVAARENFESNHGGPPPGHITYVNDSATGVIYVKDGEEHHGPYETSPEKEAEVVEKCADAFMGPSLERLEDMLDAMNADGDSSSHNHFVHPENASDPYYDTHDDKVKLRYGLTPGILYEQVAKVMTHGFDKYEGCTWKETEDGAQRYTESFLRHAMQVLEHGPAARDEGSGDLHLAHAACDAGLAMWHLWSDGQLNR